MKLKTLFSCLGLLLLTNVTFSQTIAVTNTETPETLILDGLAGGGVTIFNITYNGSVPAAQTVQPTVGFFTENGSGFPLDSGVIISTGNVLGAANPASFFASTGIGGPSDADLELLCGDNTFDAVLIEFDFIPIGDSVNFNFIFASEEYPNFAPPNGTVNDVFGFFLSGPGIAGPYSGGAENIAILPDGSDISIDNINAVTNTMYYVDNGSGTAIPYGGMSVVLSTILPTSLQCGQTYHFKIALADALDDIYDTAIFLEANSFSSAGADISTALVDVNGNPLAGNELIEGCSGAYITITNPPGYTDSTFVVNLNISGSATNGVDYSTINSSYTILPGQDTITIYVDPFLDGSPESTEYIVIESYYINPCGDTISVIDSIPIIDNAPSFNVFTTDINIDCPTGTVDVTATTDGGIPNLTFDWGAYGTGSTVQVPGNIVGTTTYTVDVTDECGITSSGTVDVTLTPAPEPTITFNQNTFTICPSQTADIDATVNNPYSTPVSYSWNPGGATTEDISVSPPVLTWYYLTIDDGCYQVTDSVKVEIGGVNISNIIVTDATDCPGQPFATPGSIQIQPDNAAWTYEIVTYVPPQNSGFFPNLDGGINYIVSVTDDLGCTSDTVVYVGLGANPVTATWIADSLRHVTCWGDNNGGAMISNIGGGILPPYDITWVHTTGLHDATSVGPGGSDEQDNLFGGTWVVTVTDQEGCAWSMPFTINEPAELTLSFLSNDPTCYLFSDGSVTAVTNGGNGSNTFTMTNASGTQLNIGNSNTINNLPTGWYYTLITDSKGCTVNDSIFVDQPGELDVDLNITDPYCFGIPGGIAIVDSVYNATGDYTQISYFWNPNPAGVGGIGANISNHMGEGSYILTINDQNGCSNDFPFTITYPDELVLTQFGYEPAYCRVFSYQSGNGVVFASASGGTGAATYQWTNLTTGQTSNNTTWGGLNPGLYQITVTDINGCTLVDQIQLDSVNPIAAFDIVSDDFYAPLEGTAVVCVDLHNQSQYFANPNNPTADTTFFWHYGYPSEPWVITHDYNQVMDTCYYEEGEYEICLVAINKNGCVDTSCQVVIVHDVPSLPQPNIFTPGANGSGDGVNDVFTFQYLAEAIVEFECVIVDRWGIVMFEMDEITDSWNGDNTKGNPCNDGVYFYTYRAVASNGTVFEGQGNIHLVREQ